MTEELEYCWSCRERKPKTEIDMSEGQYTSGICKGCQTQQENSLKTNSVKIVQKDRSPHWSGWHSKDVIIRDVSIEKDGQAYFISGFHTCDRPYETAEVFNHVKEFIENGFRWFRFYGNLEMLLAHDFWFDVSKRGSFYHFGGNCFNISNAFQLDTVDINQVFIYIEKWTPIPERLKENIKKQIDKGLIFASSPKPFDREKRFCFKEYKDDIREPIVSLVKNFHP